MKEVIIPMYSSSMLFEDYYYKWIHMYKEGSVRPITLAKYYLTHREIQSRLRGVRVNELNHYIYQKFINVSTPILKCRISPV